MKSLIHLKARIKRTLRSKNGESIMEAIVSLLVLGILMTTIVAVIRFSMVMTGNSIREATVAQESVNDMILTSAGEEREVIISINELDIEVSLITLFYEDTQRRILAFYPD